MSKFYHFKPESENTSSDFQGFIKWKYSKSDYEKIFNDTNFEIAEIYIFNLNKNSKFFKGKLKLSNLNCALKIDEKFFSDLENFFNTQSKEIIIKFKEAEENEENDNDFSFEEEKEESILIVEQLLKIHKVKLNWVKCELKGYESSNTATKICNLFSNFLDSYNNKIEILDKKLEAQKNNTLTVTKTLEAALKKFDNEKNEILEKCVLLINSKKNKIKELEDKLSLFIMKGTRPDTQTQYYGTGKIFFLIFFKAYQNTIEDDESVGLSCFSNMSKFSNFSQMSHASQIDFQRAKKMKNTLKEVKSGNKKSRKNKGKMEEEKVIKEVKSRSFRVSSVKSLGEESEESCSVFEMSDNGDDKEVFNDDAKENKRVTIFERIRLRKLSKRKRGV